MKPTPIKHVCITCKTYEVNPMISGTDKPNGKSFCSRTCQELWLRSDMQWLSMEALQRIALKRLNDIVSKNEMN